MSHIADWITIGDQAATDDHDHYRSNKPRGMIVHFSKQELYGVWVKSAKHNLGILSDPR